jgi:hypothetical protein
MNRLEDLGFWWGEKMKSQLIPISFFILSVALIIIGYLFYNLFYGKKYESYILHESILDITRNVIESLKNYLQLSLVYSSHQALREHAKAGGLMPAGDWICNNPSPPSIEDSKECLENYTTYYFNFYFSNFNTSLPLSLLKVNFSQCIYGVNERSVLNGENDEGNFWINCSDGKISVFSEDLKAYEELGINYYITKNRYWFMFRIFREWAENNVYGNCICGCCVSCGDTKCIEKCANLAYQDLQNRFNIYGNEVECKKPEKICIDHQLGSISCTKRNECLEWTDAKCKCSGHFCENPTKQKVSYRFYLTTSTECMSNKDCCELCGPPYTGCYKCESETTTTTIGTTTTTSTTTTTIIPKKCEYWIENKLASTYSFTCEDHKYYIPSKKGPIPLTFTVLATVRFRCPDVCRDTMECKYEEEKKKYVCPICPENECI